MHGITHNVNTNLNYFACYHGAVDSKTPPMPKGNPNPKCRFTTTRDEPLTEQFPIRVTKSMMELLKIQDDPREYVRQAIQEKLDRDG